MSALENVRQLEQWNRGEHGDDLASVASPAIDKVGILGGGMMGVSIAAAHVEHRVPVVVNDVDEAVLAGAAASIAADLPLEIRAQPALVSELVRVTSDAAEAARCDLVLETIVEVLPAKLRLYSQLQKHAAPRAIVASNTSTIPIRRLAESVPDASRFCGMHFLHPVRHRRLVEIVRGPRTSDETIAAATGHVRRIGRMPIVVRDGPGFLVNRLLFPYLGEALELLREGVPADAIERGAIEFGMAIGPLRLMDEIGLDTTLQAGWVLAAAFPERIVSSPLLVSLLKAGRLGQKSGAGFYTYGQPAHPAGNNDLDEKAREIIARWVDAPAKPSHQPIACRLVLPMLLEATRILEEGAVSDVRGIDLAALFGLGFPADKGGLLWWADTFGPRRILDMLSALRTSEERNRPTPLLERLAKTGGRFYPTLSQGSLQLFKGGDFR
jgi:3-hydroxyacyl-CoA dehydrogenase/enoyl-CoA hydratase/3-hydroxybutyryl-CoA epimerase/3-hydroxyacyl-CoA dehydrogenase/enoyl-CoA hydratase/3-hydroxybutyryl-CoA epimerase/enoyl-CoA isomerase